MSFAFMPFYTGDYLRDTRHLSPMKHGIYLLLLTHCWDQKGPLPLDEQECSGIANCRSQDEIEALRYVLSKYFTKMVDGHYNRRMQIEIERSEALSRSRSAAGRRGYEAKAKQLPSKSLASASTPTPTPTLTPTPIKDKSRGLRSQSSRLPPGWTPSETDIAYCKAKRPDLTLESVAEDFRDYWTAKSGSDATKLDWSATWRRWVRNQKRSGNERRSGNRGETGIGYVARRMRELG